MHIAPYFRAPWSRMPCLACSLLEEMADREKDLGSLRSPRSLAARCATACRYKMRQAVAHLAARS